ncbi:MAG: hypothetical protein ACKVOK_14670, partial [Flavobacteriales bacterium]
MPQNSDCPTGFDNDFPGKMTEATAQGTNQMDSHFLLSSFTAVAKRAAVLPKKDPSLRFGMT